MVSERIQREIERLLDEAGAALGTGDWETIRLRSAAVLTLDPDNADAAAYLQAAERATGRPEPVSSLSEGAPAVSVAEVLPTAVAGGRYEVERFLGEGGKKKVYLAHDSLLDREVAFALIKTDGLDDGGPGADRARGAGDGAPRRAPAHRVDLRPRRARGSAVHGDRADGRRRRRRAPGEGRGPAAVGPFAGHRVRRSPAVWCSRTASR